MEAGHIEIVQANTQVEDVVERAINSVQSLAERTNISLQTKVCDAVIYADEDQLIQVLVNLLSNAIKFSNANSSVTVEAVELDETVEFRVIDSGRGIGADFIDKVFDRFKQVELSDSRVKGGTGLGLAVCKMLVEAHGGNIWVTSVEGKGKHIPFRAFRKACLPKFEFTFALLNIVSILSANQSRMLCFCSITFLRVRGNKYDVWCPRTRYNHTRFVF